MDTVLLCAARWSVFARFFERWNVSNGRDRNCRFENRFERKSYGRLNDTPVIIMSYKINNLSGQESTLRRLPFES